jgi:tetratricopeptide (TPR) repeat protein
MGRHNNNSIIDSKALYEKSLIYKNERNFTEAGRHLVEAEMALLKAIEIEPDNSSYYIQLADCYLVENKIRESEEILKKVMEKEPNNVEALCRMGVCYRQQGKYEEAEGIFKKAITTEPYAHKPYWELIDTYKSQGKQEELKNLHGMLMKKDDNNDFFAALIATFYMEQKKYKKAEDYYRKANELRQRYYNPITRSNYQRLKDIIMQKGIRLVCVQHATRNVEPLKKIFNSIGGIIFVDNEKIFKEALKHGRYEDYFVDRFAGDFGHGTPKGNRLLAENIANTILKECFN